jgi:hypothetical protein
VWLASRSLDGPAPDVAETMLNSLVNTRSPDPDGIWSWSGWRRRRQYQARICHYKRRGYAFT